MIEINICKTREKQDYIFVLLTGKVNTKVYVLVEFTAENIVTNVLNCRALIIVKLTSFLVTMIRAIIH